jgi:hypothetical protein
MPSAADVAIGAGNIVPCKHVKTFIHFYHHLIDVSICLKYDIYIMVKSEAVSSDAQVLLSGADLA